MDFDPDEDVCLEIAEGRSLDVLEIDGASNRGIDNIRDLRDNVQFTPTRGQYRIIYIDALISSCIRRLGKERTVFTKAHGNLTKTQPCLPESTTTEPHGEADIP